MNTLPIFIGLLAVAGAWDDLDRHPLGRLASYYSVKAREVGSEKKNLAKLKDHGHHSNSLLDTFSLSFVGNFEFSHAYEGVRKIIHGIATFIDLKVIKAGVDAIFESLFPDPSFKMVDEMGPSARKDIMENDEIFRDDPALQEEIKRMRTRERMRTGMTTILGAALNKQDCWNLTTCTLGGYLKQYPARDVFFIMARKILPESWLPTIGVMSRSASELEECTSQYQCDPNVDGRNI